MASWDGRAQADLGDVLADLYGHNVPGRVIARAGFKAEQINLDGPARDKWFAILEHARHHENVLEVVPCQG